MTIRKEDSRTWGGGGDGGTRSGRREGQELPGGVAWTEAATCGTPREAHALSFCVPGKQ